VNAYEQDELAQLAIRIGTAKFAEGRAAGRQYEPMESRLATAAAAEQAFREFWMALYGLRVEGKP
jgi:hypothetical protein